MVRSPLFLALPLLRLSPAPGAADPAQIVAAELARTGDSWRASVTLRHGDTGWEDYADGWRIEAPDGTVLGTRVLHHPHVEEQPFTRSQGGITIPGDLSEVHVRARTNTDGWADTTLVVTLP